MTTWDEAVNAPNLVDALRELRPGCQFVIRSGVLEYRGPGIAPTDTELQTKLNDMLAEYVRTKYQRDRAREYPSIADLTVALWEQIVENRPQTAITLQNIRNTIKSKYPKS